MIDLTPAEREELAIEVMGWHKGWLLVPSAAPDNYLWFETEMEAAKYRWGHNWIADVVEAYGADGHYVLLADWLPDRNIEQAMGLLMAMRETGHTWTLSGFKGIHGSLYSVYIDAMPSSRNANLVFAICRAVLAALEVK